MEDADTPPTEPSGALVPPTKIPGTAIAVATPPPPPRGSHSRTMRRSNPFRELLTRTFDAVDNVADAVASGLGLRH